MNTDHDRWPMGSDEGCAAAAPPPVCTATSRIARNVAAYEIAGLQGLDLSVSAAVGDYLLMPDTAAATATANGIAGKNTAGNSGPADVRLVRRLPYASPHVLLYPCDVLHRLVRIPSVSVTSILSYAFGAVTCWVAMRGGGGGGGSSASVTDASNTVGTLSRLLSRGSGGGGHRSSSLLSLWISRLIRVGNIITLALWYRRFLRKRVVKVLPISAVVDEAEVKGAGTSSGGTRLVSRRVVSMADSHAGTHADQPMHFMPRCCPSPSAPLPSPSPFPLEHYCGHCMVVDVSDLVEAQWGRALAKCQQQQQQQQQSQGGEGDGGAPRRQCCAGEEPLRDGSALAITEDIVREALLGRARRGAGGGGDGGAPPVAAIGSDLDDSDEGGDEDGSNGLELSTLCRVVFITRRRRAARAPIAAASLHSACPASQRSIDAPKATAERYFRGYGMEECTCAAGESGGDHIPPPPSTTGDAAAAAAAAAFADFVEAGYYPPYTAAGLSTSYFTPSAAALLATVAPRLVLVGLDGPEVGQGPMAVSSCIPQSSPLPLHEGPLGIWYKEGIATLTNLNVEPVLRVVGGGMARGVGAGRTIAAPPSPVLASPPAHANGRLLSSPSSIGADFPTQPPTRRGSGAVGPFPLHHAMVSPPRALERVVAAPLSTATATAPSRSGEGATPAIAMGDVSTDADHSGLRCRFTSGSLLTVFSEQQNFVDAKGCTVLFFPCVADA